MTTQLTPNVSLTYAEMTLLLEAHETLGNDRTGTDELGSAFCGDPVNMTKLEVELSDIAAAGGAAGQLAQTVLTAL